MPLFIRLYYLKKLSEVLKKAVLEYYKSVGNSSAVRLQQVQQALDAVTYLTNGFPITTPPGLGELVGSQTNSYTEGDHIYFREPKLYDPKTSIGLARAVREFTHVMQ